MASRIWSTVERSRAEAVARSRQAELAETAAALNALVANAPIGFAFFDRRSRYTSINVVLAEINGVPPREHIGRTIDDLLPAHAAAVRPIIERVFETGEAISGVEIDGETPAHPGENRSWLTGYFPVFGADGAVTQVGATVVDITDRKRAEVRLRENEERLRLATDHAEVGFWDVDEVNHVLHWPPLVKAMFGISADTPVSMDDFYAGLHPDDRDRTSAAYAAAADPARRALYDVEYRTIGKEDGVVRWVAAKGRGVFDSRGVCLRVVGTAMDITPRKQAEERLRELNETLERRVEEALAERKLWADVFESSDALIAALDADMRLIAMNNAAMDETERLCGRRPRLGDLVTDLYADVPELREDVEAIWRRALAGEAFSVQKPLGDKERHRRCYELTFRPLYDREGRFVGAYQYGVDVTERAQAEARLRETEEALRQAQKMEAVGQLTGGIAHDFNNLLQGVAGSLDLIRRKPEDRQRVERWAEAGLKAAERGARLTGRLLAFSRAQKMELKPVTLSDLVSGFRDMIDRTIGAHVRVHLDLKTDGVRVLGDEVQIEMAVLNLALNARDAMPDGGELTIATRPLRIVDDPELPDGEYVELSVRDTGAGMPPEILARAFDPFYTTKGVGKGTGLGLSQVYAAMRQAGGAARIESRVGEGTTVRLYLRRTDDAEMRRTDQEGREAQAGVTARVLVVDDDPDVRRFMAESLDALGFSVVEAEDGDSGLAALDASGPDVMILDYAMPGLNGAEVARRAQQKRPDLPIIFATGFAESAEIEAVAGATAPVLRKPFRVDELQAVLAEALTGRS